MSVSVATRFEVFKRDDFTCSYCGRTRDDGAKLEVDHIVPRAGGGSDELDNLTTSCWDCNHGKGARPLSRTAPAVSDDAIARTRARVERQREYQQLLAEEREQFETARAVVLRAWAEAWDAEVENGYYVLPDHGYWPTDASLKAILTRLPADAAARLVLVTRRRFERPGVDACRYFYGCCWNEIKSPRPADEGTCDECDSKADRIIELELDIEDLRVENDRLRARVAHLVETAEEDPVLRLQRPESIREYLRRVSA